jgi:hypothetical protein
LSSFLANMRWLCLSSDNLGQDWFQKAQQIDSVMTEEGHDLSEESTYLLFSETPEKILNGEGHCLIARPVIGPKKIVKAPFTLLDWMAAPVWQETLHGESLTDLLHAALKARENTVEASRTYAGAFSLRVSRKLNPALILSVEVIFHE